MHAKVGKRSEVIQKKWREGREHEGVREGKRRK